MASSQRPAARTASTCTPEAARGAHVFKIAGYSMHRGVGVGQSVRSAPFAVGGFDFCIRFYPDGYSSSEDHAAHVAVFLHLLSSSKKKNNAQPQQVRASVDFRLVDQATGQRLPLPSSTAPAAGQAAPPPPKVTLGTEFGTCRFIKRTELEASAAYLNEDCLVIECDVLVIKEPRAVAAAAAAIVPEFEVAQLPPPPPHSDLSGNLRKLLEEKRGADVTFKVRDELFHAHKIVLAMRSPVFGAEFYGPMAAEGTSTGQCVAIEDMHPEAFRALLHFIYTDEMPDMEGCSVDDRQEITKHLLVAADRYALERLKLICESILCRSLNADNVVTMLALAEEHYCNNLRQACVEFITSSSNRINNVVPRAFPAIFVDMLGSVARCMHGCFQFVGISRAEDI